MMDAAGGLIVFFGLIFLGSDIKAAARILSGKDKP